MSNFKYRRPQIEKARIAFKDEALYFQSGCLDQLPARARADLCLQEFRFRYSIKVSTRCCCAAAVIGSRAVLPAMCSGVILKICPLTPFISREEASAAAPPSFPRSAGFVVQPACVIFFGVATVSPPTAGKKEALDFDSTGEKTSRNKMKGAEAPFCCVVFPPPHVKQFVS